MQVFVAFKISDPKRVKSELELHYKGNYYDAGDNVYFISTVGETTRQLATKIGLGDDDGVGVTSGIVLPVTNFWGRQNKDLWEWINVSQAA